MIFINIQIYKYNTDIDTYLYMYINIILHKYILYNILYILEYIYIL